MLAVGSAGCIFSPKKDTKTPPVNPPAVYVLPSYPADALQNLVTAYVNRDSVRCIAVYADDYLGSSKDLTDPNSPPELVFHKQDELNHVGALYHASSITEVIFNIGSPGTWTRLTSDDANHPDWAVIQVVSHDVEVTDGATRYEAKGTNPFIFKFKPTLDSSMPSDTMWTVVRWVEVH